MHSNISRDRTRFVLDWYIKKAGPCVVFIRRLINNCDSESEVKSASEVCV